MKKTLYNIVLSSCMLVGLNVFGSVDIINSNMVVVTTSVVMTTNTVSVSALKIHKLSYDFDIDKVQVEMTYVDTDTDEILASGWASLTPQGTNNYTVVIYNTSLEEPSILIIPVAMIDVYGLPQGKATVVAIAQGLGQAITEIAFTSP